MVFPRNFPDAWRNGTGDGQGEWLSLSGDGALESVDGNESPPDLRAFSAILPRQQKHEPSQAVDRGADHLVAVMTDASMEVFTHPARLPIADRIHPVTDDAFALLATEGTERWTSVRPESVGRPWDHCERSRHSIHGGGRWEWLEDTLSLLAERPTRELRDDMLDPLDALFARIGR